MPTNRRGSWSRRDSRDSPRWSRSSARASSTADGELDRRALRERIFADPHARRDLEAILHPLIRADMERRADEAAGPYLVLAIPLLVEGGSRNPSSIAFSSSMWMRPFNWSGSSRGIPSASIKRERFSQRRQAARVA